MLQYSKQQHSYFSFNCHVVSCNYLKMPNFRQALGGLVIGAGTRKEKPPGDECLQGGLNEKRSARDTEINISGKGMPGSGEEKLTLRDSAKARRA